MIEMNININMDKKSYDICISNSINDKTIDIKFTEKNLNAAKVYDFLTYSVETKYSLFNNADDIDEGNEKDYFLEIIKLFGDITVELNELNGFKVDELNDNLEEVS